MGSENNEPLLLWDKVLLFIGRDWKLLTLFKVQKEERLPTAVAFLEAFYGIYGAKKKVDEDRYTIPRCSVCNSNVMYLYFIPPEGLLVAGFS